MDYSEMVSQNDKTLLLAQNYKYYFDRKNKNRRTVWHCIKKMYVYNISQPGKKIIVDKSIVDNHDHAIDTTINQKIISNGIKRKIDKDHDNLTQRPMKLIRTEAKQYKEELDITTNNVALVRRNIHNTKRSYMPKLPTKRHEVHDVLRNTIFNTNWNEPFLLVNNE